jgi:DDE superfamily endonuclease
MRHDGTARRLERPQNAPAPTRGDRGTKKGPTVQNGLWIQAARLIRVWSDPSAGSRHDKRMADAPPDPWPAGSRLRQDRGVLALTLPQLAVSMPTHKPRGRALTRTQNAANRRIARRHVRLEPVHRRVKRGRMVHDTCRLRKAGVRELLIDVCCGLHPFRVRRTPWQRMGYSR